MPLTPDDVLDFLELNQMDARTYSHPPVHTVAESQALRGDIPGLHTKNLFLRDGKKTYFLVSIEENTPVDLKALRGKIGARGGLSFGSAEALYEHLGVLPGAVSLLAVLNDKDRHVTVALDEALLEAPFVNCHPLTNEKTTSLTPERLLTFLELTGHTPLRISMAEDPQA
ncbi:prolyl-tRNA synthetase associated domain-containing protein [Xanthobacter sp. DSM 24535]|uniref:prolyl-tRNA synthetase associated domain-containing protein n=1 Tax=Roseixanthobacter psychrophilus TaxID=3119917 RepID=UPI003729D47E